MPFPTTEARGSLSELITQGIVAADRLPMPTPVPNVPGYKDIETHGTTVIAVKYKDGLINVADRRATAGYTIMYDQAEKVLALDDHTLISISGSFAKSVEVVRYLRHTFKYFERSQLQPMSQEGKLMELQRVIANNMPAALQGIGAFIPVLSTFDTEENQGRIYFYDAMGGQFETAEYGAAGSGSAPIRGAFEYILRTKGPFRNMDRLTALKETITLLEIAADLDTATGGSAKFLPAAKYITADGIHDFTDDEIKSALGRA
ncbi:proteasome subunit beta [Capsulimonas corticalis]|uniref:Proteasome subunit beta n=1 Tax=Capsulimonas corticalis TaxID=2219043 RepID=A0A402CPU8_9BACT|nr:proteasome subunit alpha [Capsulimonas corticalis]BDI32943.1 proteasome subunit beta [Capsulimonas corticalis]